jgi:hypothetical protein
VKVPTTPLIALAALVVTGCSTVVTARPVTSTSTPAGVRYSLPKPVLHVTPSADGSVSVDVLFLPDPAKTYAIDSFTFLAAHSLDVMVSKGLLQKVGAISDTTVVAADLVRAAGTVRADMTKQQADALTAKQTAVNSAQSALDTAESALAAEQAALDALIAQGAPTADINLQRKVVAQKKGTRDAARDVLDRVQNRNPTPTPTSGTFTASTTGTGITLEKLEPDATATVTPVVDKVIGGAGKKSVWGAKVYAIEEGFVGDPKRPSPTITLREMTFREPDSKVPVTAQREFATVALGTTTTVPKQDKTGELVILLDPRNIGNLELKSTTSPIAKLDPPPYKLEPATSPVKPAVSLEAGGTTVRIDVSRMSPGTYTLTVPFQWVTGDGRLDKADWLVTFRVLSPT